MSTNKTGNLYPFVTKATVKGQLDSDPAFRIQAMAILHTLQTKHEQATKTTLNQQDRVAHDDAGPRDEADHRGRGERCAKQPMSEHDADQCERDRRQNNQRQLETAELRHHQDIDADDRHHEGGTHVAEGDIGDLPLAVPQNRRLAFVLGLAMEADSRFAERAPIMCLDALALLFNPYWLLLAAFVGANMLQAAFTGFCPAAKIFSKLGLKPGPAFACTAVTR